MLAIKDGLGASTQLRTDLEGGIHTPIHARRATQGFVVLTPGQPVQPGSSVFIATTAPGNVRLVMADDSFLDVPVQVGPTMISDIAVKDVSVAETTAAVVVSIGQ